MIESPIIAKLLNEAETKATTKATAETRITDLLLVLRKRFGTLPDDLSVAIRACANIEQLDRWLDLALDKRTLAQFRRHAGL